MVSVYGRPCGHARLFGGKKRFGNPAFTGVSRGLTGWIRNRWIGRIVSQSKRATNCATPGYEIFQLWSNMGSAPVFDQFPARGKTPSALASQSFPGFWKSAARTPASRSQIGTERFFELFPLNFGSFRSVPLAFCHSLNVLFPYTPHHTVAAAVVKKPAK